MTRACTSIVAPGLAMLLPVAAGAGQVVGVTVTPHIMAPSMRYSRSRGGGPAARVQLFVKGPAMPGRFAGKTPAELLKSGDWAWHDTGAAGQAPVGALCVWTFNGKSERWSVGQAFSMEGDGLPATRVAIDAPLRWMSAVTFLASDGSASPDTLVVHMANEGSDPVTVTGLRLWLPRAGGGWQTLWPQKPVPVALRVPARDKGVVVKRLGRLPLTYCAVELTTSAGPLWAHLRIKREAFDISGGWVGDNVTKEPYLRLLSHLHVNTGHLGATPGYTDNPDLYRRFPLKLFNKLDPLATFDTDAWLPNIHAVEWLGEPQYGGGRPVPPQDVFDQLLPYRQARLATTVTHSEERIWRWYAGLSDYPHYDSYRVVAPSADQWRLYDRWGGKRLRWGAPLETIGDMCRSLRELNRPAPCAYWSQGPHDGWDGFDGRARRSPTPEELRSQAMHGLATRITSIYWFNLSLKSLMAFPDTWDAMTRIGREIRMLDDLYLTGDAYRFERLALPDGSPDWDLASIAAPDAALLFALDTRYVPDPKANVFQFGPPRTASFRFALPSRLRKPLDLFRVDADGIHPARWSATAAGVEITDERSQDGIYIATRDRNLRTKLEAKRLKAIAHEEAHPIDIAALKALLGPAKRD